MSKEEKKEKILNTKALNKNFSIRDLYYFFNDILNERFGEEYKGIKFKILNCYEYYNKKINNKIYLKDYLEIIKKANLYNSNQIPIIIPLNFVEFEDKNVSQPKHNHNIINTFLEDILSGGKYGIKSVSSHFYYIDGKESIKYSFSYNQEGLDELLDSNELTTKKTNLNNINLVDPIDDKILNSNMNYTRDNRDVNSMLYYKELDIFLNKYYKDKNILLTYVNIEYSSSQFYSNILNLIGNYNNYLTLLDNQKQINSIVFKNNSEYHKILKEYNNTTSQLKSIFIKFNDVCKRLNNVVKNNTETTQESKAEAEIENIKRELINILDAKAEESKTEKLEVEIVEDLEIQSPYSGTRFEVRDRPSTEPNTFSSNEVVLNMSNRYYDIISRATLNTPVSSYRHDNYFSDFDAPISLNENDI
jgi:hypothetical protein